VLERVILHSQRPGAHRGPEGRAGCPTRLPVSRPDASRHQAPAGTNPTMVTVPRLESRGSVTPELLSFQRPARRRRDLQDYQPDASRATRQSAKNRPESGRPRRSMPHPAVAVKSQPRRASCAVNPER
jgi:hypothetical protein